MSRFLWVEDFEDQQYREFTHTLFGPSLLLQNIAFFPDEEGHLREFLARNQITLATTYAEATRLIDKKLDDFDYIVLDIDLDLLDQDEDKQTDIELVEKELRDWYGYEPANSESEKNYADARNEMKKVAGYHLYINLVLDKGFSKHQILFCSNHGNHLESINSSFKTAKIKPPKIYNKTEEDPGKWVSKKRTNKYTLLRRWIINACNDLLNKLDKKDLNYRIPEILRGDPSEEDKKLAAEDAKRIIETLPLLLPAIESSDEKKRLDFRLFVRTLTQDWDNKIDFNKIDKEIKKGIDKASNKVLLTARNWTSHSGKALTSLQEDDVAFLFLIAMRLYFWIDQNNSNEEYELPLLELIGKECELDISILKKWYETTYDEVNDRWKRLPNNANNIDTNNFFDSMVNDLQQAGDLTSTREHEEMLRNIFWHKLHWKNRDGNFDPKPTYFTKTKFSESLTKRLFAKMKSEGDL